jgi:hypothetical protein
VIEIDPEAALELLDARDYYERARPGLGAVFELVAQRTLDAIESSPEQFPAHPFATTPGVHRAIFLRPPRFPFALSYLVRAERGPYVLAAEHLRRAPMYWSARLRASGPP